MSDTADSAFIKCNSHRAGCDRSAGLRRGRGGALIAETNNYEKEGLQQADKFGILVHGMRRFQQKNPEAFLASGLVCFARWLNRPLRPPTNNNANSPNWHAERVWRANRVNSGGGHGKTRLLRSFRFSSRITGKTWVVNYFDTLVKTTVGVEVKPRPLVVSSGALKSDTEIECAVRSG
jgi:hypothetical protein